MINGRLGWVGCSARPTSRRFALTSAAGCLILSAAAQATVTQLRARLVDPATAMGQSGSWAVNGYNAAALDTWRIYAVSNIADEIVSVGDIVPGGAACSIVSNNGAFINATGALGNNGIQRPADVTMTPGLPGYTSQWDTFITIDGLASVFPADGLTAALGATPTGMGGLTGNVSIDNTGWFDVVNLSPNTTFNPLTSDHECMIMQLTVVNGVGFAVNNAVIVSVFAGPPSSPLSVSVPSSCPSDVDGDQTTGFADLTAILLHWGPCPSPPAPCPWDIDGTGDVGFGDLTALLLEWGPC